MQSSVSKTISYRTVVTQTLLEISVANLLLCCKLLIGYIVLSSDTHFFGSKCGECGTLLQTTELDISS